MGVGLAMTSGVGNGFGDCVGSGVELLVGVRVNVGVGSGDGELVGLVDAVGLGVGVIVNIPWT